MRNKVVALLVMLIATACSKAQTIGGLLDEDRYNIRVKLVDEFFERFNSRDSLQIGQEVNVEDPGVKKLLVLFDAKLFKSLEDSAFAEAKAFVQTVLKNDVLLNYKDSTWVAKAECHGAFQGKPVEFTLYLNVEHRRGNLYKWVIAKAEGDLFNLKPSLEKESIMMMPDDHETNFLSLKRITTEKDDYILNYKQKQFELDPTSVFYAFVNSGLLNIEFVKPLSFLFFQVPGYKFELQHVERDNLNVGWLISGFEKITDSEKMKFLNYIYSK